MKFKLLKTFLSLILLAPTAQAIEIDFKPKIELVLMEGFRENTTNNGRFGGVVGPQRFYEEECSYDPFDGETYCTDFYNTRSGDFQYQAVRDLTNIRVGMEIEINGRFGVVLDIQRAYDRLVERQYLQSHETGRNYVRDEHIKKTGFNIIGIEAHYKMNDVFGTGEQLQLGVRSNYISGDIPNSDNFITAVARVKIKINDKSSFTVGFEGNDNFYGGTVGYQFE